jgi:hypothetical protein
MEVNVCIEQIGSLSSSNGASRCVARIIIVTNRIDDGCERFLTVRTATAGNVTF